MRPLLFFLVFVLFFVPASSQQRAVRATTKPTIDGILEDAWNGATKFEAFRQIEPAITEDATVKTEAYVLYDDKNFYVGMKMYQRKATIHSNGGRRDAGIVSDGDWVSICLDPMNGSGDAYFYIINAVNAVADGMVDINGTTSMEWDGIFFSATHIDEEYWSVELQVPLSSINFQNEAQQDWKVFFARRYAGNQETSTSRLVDINSPWARQNYNKLTDLSGLTKTKTFRVTPYGYYHSASIDRWKSTQSMLKVGGEVRYTPMPSMTVLATIHPDYAQLESDQEVVNVSDLPTEYPEKRPFFTESSDFYPGAAVRTRNIVDIKVGVKIRQLGDIFRYDVTGVLDGDNNRWLLGNVKLSESNSYLAEIIGGIKSRTSRHDYNVTTHMAKRYLERQITLSNWIGTINAPEGGKNEWEMVTGASWNARTLGVSLSNRFRSRYYNPNIVGWNYLSNFNQYSGSLRYTLINESGFYRTGNFSLVGTYTDLMTPSGNGSMRYELGIANTLHLGESLGNWLCSVTVAPPTVQKFRYRLVDNVPSAAIYDDAISSFVLIKDRWIGVTASIESDVSKGVGGSVSYNNDHVRQSSAHAVTSKVFWKLNPRSAISYSVDYIRLQGSPYQTAMKQMIHRVQAEYSVTDKLHLRLIIQPNNLELPGPDRYVQNSAAYNFAATWEYAPGSFVYLVYNNFNKSSRAPSAVPGEWNENQSVILKINRSLSY